MSGAAAFVPGLLVALGVGLLVGLERERAKGDGPDRAAAGIRTFLLFGLGGAVADMLGAVALAVAGLFVALAAIAAYRRTRARDPGLTTEIAMLVVFLLGVLAMRLPQAAGALGVVVALILAGKSQLHRFSKDVLTEQELHDLLLLTAAAFVVMPMLPDRSVDPWQALNPHRLWWLVVAVMAIASLGYIALRAFGARIGLLLAGLAGGFVSSTATIAAMGDRARASPDLCAAAASAGLMSNVGTAIQLAVVVGALSPALLRQAALPLAAAAAVAIAAAAWSGLQAWRTPARMESFAGRRPFEPLSVLRFVAMLAAVMLLAAIVREWLGEAGVVWALGLSGLADVHAAAASAGQLVATGRIGLDVAGHGLVAALAANSLLKCVVAVSKGGAAYALRIVPGVAAMLLAFAAATAFAGR